MATSMTGAMERRHVGRGALRGARNTRAGRGVAALTRVTCARHGLSVRLSNQEPRSQTVHDDFVTYDELAGPDLDSSRWTVARLPLPTGETDVPVDANAEVAVGDGEVRVEIPRFSLSHDAFQVVDSPKYLA